MVKADGTVIFLELTSVPEHKKRSELLPEAPIRWLTRVNVLLPLDPNLKRGNSIVLKIYEGDNMVGHAMIHFQLPMEIHDPRVGEYLIAKAYFDEIDMEIEVDDEKCRELIFKATDGCGWLVTEYKGGHFTDDWIRQYLIP